MTIKFNTIKVVKTLCVAAALAALAAGVYVFMAVKELRLKLNTASIQSSASAPKVSVLEPGSIARRQTLERFAVFARGGREALKRGFEEKSVIARGPKALVEDETNLPPLLPNHCRRYRCLQNRIKFNQIPSSLWKGLLGIEDYRFLQHEGVDPVSIARALIADIKAMSLVQGGSTLTQQLAKNLFLTNEKKLERKLREMIYALYLERAYTKEEIVTMYFNEVFWGALGGVYIKGVDMASRIYFGKAPSELDDFEASILIGMLKGPYYYHPIKHLERLKNRTAVVYERLSKLRLVSSDASLEWNDPQWESWREDLKEKDGSNYLRDIYLAGQNRQNALEPFEKFVFYQAVSRIRKELAPRTKGADIAVKAAIAGAECSSLECAKTFAYYSKFERDLSKAVFEEKHQVGSVLKPIIYQQLLEEGKTLGDTVSTAPVTLDLLSGKWTPSDYSYGDKKEVTLKYAIQKSRNTPLIRFAKETGFDALEERLLDYFPDMLTPLGQYPAQLLGAIELSLNDLTSAYLKFFRRQCERFEKGESAYEESLLYHLAQAEETTIARVAGKVIRQSLIFGKTGTTNNGLDNWYIAYDGQNFYAIWFGVDSRRDEENLKLYGANSAFRIFQDFIQYRGKQVAEFHCR